MNAKMANWMVGVVLPVALATGCVVDSVASKTTRTALEGPVVLTRDNGRERIVVETGFGEGVPFGYRYTYPLPEGLADENAAPGVVCIGRFSRLSCDGGWELAPKPDSAAWTPPASDVFYTRA